MTRKTMMSAVLAFAVAGAMPALAQSTTAGAPDPTMNPSTRTPGMAATPDNAQMAMPKMSKSQMASWRKCQAMSQTAMMKSATCKKLSKMNGGMANEPM